MPKFFSFVLVIGMLFLFPFCSANAQEFDKIVTGDAIVFLETNHALAPEQEFPNFEEAIGELIATFDDFLEWRILKAEWDAFWDVPELKNGLSALKGDQYAVSVFGMGEAINQIPSVVYMSNVDDPQKADQVLKTLFERATELHLPLIQEQDLFQDFQIQSLYGPGMIPGLSLAYSFNGNLLLISTSKPKLVQLLENMDMEENKLADDPLYQSVLEKLPRPRYSTLFMNLSGIPQIAENIINSLRALQMINKDRDLQQALEISDILAPYFTKTVKAMGTAYQAREEGHQIATTYTMLYPEIADTIFSPLLDKEPADFEYEQYLPRKTGSFYASNVLTFHDIWGIFQKVTKELPEEMNPMDQLETFQQEIGFSIENDFLSWMGDEWCFVQMIMDLNSIVPTNRAAIFFSVNDVEKANQTLDKIHEFIQKNEVPVTIEGEQYRGTAITTYRPPIPVIPLSPSWCIDEGKLIFASDAGLLREMLDVKAGSVSGIKRNRYYRELTTMMEKPSNFLSFQDTESQFYTYREALRRVSSVSELGKEFAGEHRMIPFLLMDRGSYLLTCLQVLKANTKRFAIVDGGVMSQKETIQRDLRAVPSTKALLRYKTSLGAKEVIVNLAGWLAEKGDLERASRMFEILNEFYPTEQAYLSALSKIYTKLGDKSKAIEVYEESLEAAPSTAMLIELEKARASADAEAILQRVRSQSEKTDRIREDAALFGIALAKRDGGELETAAALFEALVKRSTISDLTEAAIQELRIMENEQPEKMISIPRIDEQPEIDGNDTDEIWNEATPPYPFIPLNGQESESNEYPASVRLAHDEDNIYILIEGEEPKDSEKDTDEFTFRVGPTRDYIHFTVFHTNRKVKDGKINIQTSDISKTIIDTHNIILNEDYSRRTWDDSWLASISEEDGNWCIEMSIPLEQIEMVEGIGLLNAERNARYGDKEVDQSLSGKELENTADYFYVQLAD